MLESVANMLSDRQEIENKILVTILRRHVMLHNV